MRFEEVAPKRKCKPTRRDLLIVVSRCQNLFGSITGAFSDRNPNRAAQLYAIEKQGFELCLEALEQDPPVDDLEGLWANDGSDDLWRDAR